MSILYIVVPCYNEVDCLPQTAPVFLKKLQELIECGKIDPQSRVLLVNDGSSDGTWALIKSLHEGDVHFSGLSLSPNRGHQNAAMAGLMEARERADVAITIDCDLQDDIHAIDEMVDKYLNGAHIVCGVRNSRATDTFFKRFTARAYYALMNLFGARLVFDHADFRLMDREALDRLSLYHGEDPFLRGLATRLGLPLEKVVYDRAARELGESKYTLKKMLKLAATGFACGRKKPENTPRPADPHIAERLF